MCEWDSHGVTGTSVLASAAGENGRSIGPGASCRVTEALAGSRWGVGGGGGLWSDHWRPGKVSPAAVQSLPKWIFPDWRRI